MEALAHRGRALFIAAALSGIVTTSRSSQAQNLFVRGQTNSNQVLTYQMLVTDAAGNYNGNGGGYILNCTWCTDTEGTQPRLWIAGVRDTGQHPLARLELVANRTFMVGQVGIGSWPVGSYMLYVAGSAFATGGFNQASAREYKEDIHYLGAHEQAAMLQRLKQLKLAQYRYKQSFNADGARRLGFIADELPREVLASDGKAVDLYELVSYAIGALKAQQVEIEELKAQLTRRR
jgi:hypothetical protein